MEVIERRGVGGYCVAGDDVAWRMGRILLRYRPIAPKPLAAGTALGGVVQAALSGGCRERRRGGTRRQSGVAGGRRGRKSRKLEVAALGNASGDAAAVVTLPLMPETPERKEEAHAAGCKAFESAAPWSGTVVAPRPVRVVGVSVTVERVSETWGVELCREMGGDEEIRRWLDSDDSPAFVSDAENRVTWTNAACRRMVVGGAGGGAVSQTSSSSSSCQSSPTHSRCISPPEAAPATEEVVKVALVTRGLVPPGDTYRAFTCMARVRYMCRRRGMVSLSSPCDAWRLEDGSLAWRLDVKTALSLSIRA